MPTRYQAFRATVRHLEQEFLERFHGKPKDETQSLMDRIRRSLSWLSRAAEVSPEDRPPRFVDLWISLNALYGRPPYIEYLGPSEKEHFEDFLRRLAHLRSGPKKLVELMSRRHIANRAQELVQNKYLWNEWWNREIADYNRLSGERLVFLQYAATNGNAVTFFRCLFERLQVLRNQIIHGSSSSTTRKSRNALYPAILILEEIIPEFIKLMIQEGANADWPPIPYPGKDTPQHPE